MKANTWKTILQIAIIIFTPPKIPVMVIKVIKDFRLSKYPFIL